MKTRVTVVGSALVDHAHRLERAPRWGETVQAVESGSFPGGKGLNQAIAAQRLGADVTLVAAVGDDTFGRQVLQALAAEGVRTDGLHVMPGRETRRNLVLSDDDGHASFIQTAHPRPALLTVEHIGARTTAITDCDVLLLTLEPPAEVLRAVMDAVMTVAVQERPAVFVNPAPAERMPVKLPWSFYSDVTCLVPNLIEAAAVTNPRSRLDPRVFGDSNDVARARALARKLRRRGVERACITVGSSGCVSLDHGAIEVHPGFPTDRVIDATGASDAFCAALALALVRDEKSLVQAVREANAAGAHAVTVLGAAPSMPSPHDVARVLKRSDAVAHRWRPRRLRWRPALPAPTPTIGLLTAVLALIRQLTAR